MVINSAVGCSGRFWRLHPFNTWVISPHLAEFWAEGWSWWPPRVAACFSTRSSNESHLHQAPLARVKWCWCHRSTAGEAWQGQGWQHKCRESSCGRQCWWMLLLWGEGCSSIRLAIEAASPRQKYCSWAREIIMRWIWIESALPLDLLPRQSSTAWCPPVWRGKIISAFPGLHTCLYCLVPTTWLIIVPTTQSLIMISFPLLSTPSWLTRLVSGQRSGPVYPINKYTSFLFVLWR